MSLSTLTNYDDILEKVTLKGDLVDLTPRERVDHILNICRSLKLNPVTQPIKLLETTENGKKKIQPYIDRGGSEQLRFLHKVSITKIESSIEDEKIYIVKAYAATPDGRTDCSTSAKYIVKVLVWENIRERHEVL